MYQAAGNVAFDSGEEDAAALSELLDAGLTECLGYECTVFLRTAAEVREIAAAEPFGGDTAGKVHVALLGAPPPPAVADEALTQHASETERLAFSVGARELFWQTPGGITDATLDLNALEKLVGPWTMRTKGTIERFTARHLAE